MKRIALILFFLIVLTGSAVAKDYHANHYDVRLEIMADGSLFIEEDFKFTFKGGPFSEVYRSLRLPKHDEIKIASFALDGQTMSEGEGEYQVRIDKKSSPTVTWQLPETYDASYTFTLTYYVEGVFQQGKRADVLNWPLLPQSFDYSIDSSTIEVIYPRGIKPLDSPKVTGDAWGVTENSDGFTIVAKNISPNRPIRFDLSFAPGAIISRPSRWQQAEDKVRRSVYMYLALALALVLLGIALIARLLRDRSYQLAPFTVSEEQSSPPNDLAPALAGTLIAPGMEANWNHAVATIFHLADRGALELVAPEKKSWDGGTYRIVQLESQEELTTWEEKFLQVLFTYKGERFESISFRQIKSGYYKKIKAWKELIKEELTRLGYFDKKSESFRGRFILGGILALFLSIVGLPICLITQADHNWPLVFIPLAFLFLSLVAIIAGATFSPFTEEGTLAAKEWQSFAKHLRTLLKRKNRELVGDYFANYLPYAAAFGSVVGWLNAAKKVDEVKIPAWYKSLAQSDPEAISSLAVMTIYMVGLGGSSSTGTGAGGGGGGGGGAASGAR